MRMLPATLGALGIAAACLSPAAAHVTLDPGSAGAETTVRAALRVPHGCDGAATTRIAVRLPEGVTGARPMPKAGWRLILVPRADAPQGAGHGAAVEVEEIAWEGGPLPDAHYEEFVLRFRTPNRPGETLWFPVVQGCEAGRSVAWTAVPEAGRRVSDYPTPAAALRLNAR